MTFRISLLTSILGLSLSLCAQDGEFTTPYEKSGKTETATYAEAIEHYERLTDEYRSVQILTYGITDVGKPLHVVVLSRDPLTTGDETRLLGKRVLLVNNGIHPGEPCGIDACMMLARDLMEKEELSGLLNEVVLCIIPVYNVGGALNRGSFSRANQVGPKAYGFRGNARNFDLNRDFIKCDTRNALSFAGIFHEWQPDVFIDTHTTDGADYPAALTVIPTLGDKAAPAIAGYMEDHLIPAIQKHMDARKIKTCPYVYSTGRTPDDGIKSFIDHPRYSSGYTNLFQSMGIITEAHMLKTFEERVTATYEFLLGTLMHMNEAAEAIGAAREAGRKEVRSQSEHVLTWSLDKKRVDKLMFEGYAARYKRSSVTDRDRLYYDRNEPYRKEISHLKHYKAEVSVPVPDAYVVPQSYHRVIDRMKANGIQMKALERDTIIEGEVSYITRLESRDQAYEGHFYHDRVETRRERQQVPCYAGDMVVPTDQPGVAYLVHVLEPEAHDSFFRWGFFDGILMQKEYFSPYLFEDIAEKMLAEDADLKKAFEKKKAADEVFAKNWWEQLMYLYRNSPYYEKTHMRYPVLRLN